MDAPKPRILVFVAYYLPGYKAGGPLRTIESMVERLHEDFEFQIITRDRDMGDTTPYQDIQVAHWQQVGKAQVYYLLPNELSSPQKLHHHIQTFEYDIVYLNSHFYTTSVIYLVLRRLHLVKQAPVILAPRGELSPGALSLKSGKKAIYVALTKLLGLCEGVLWHASGEHEKDEIKRIYRKADVHVAFNLSLAKSTPPDEVHLRKKEVGKAKIVYLSRITPKKNLKLAVQLLSNLQGYVEFDIIGSIEDFQYWEECQNSIAALPGNLKVNYLGTLPHRWIIPMLQQYHLLLLPTLGENFGHVILEAFTAGCLVLISDQTPWRDLQASEIGWDLPLEDTNAFQRALQEMVDMDDETFQSRSQTALRFSEDAIGDAVIETNRQLFLKAIQIK
jgi:glycosyltransferase involved in cell wall biosynthesis